MPRWFEPHAQSPPYFCVVGHPITHSRSPQIHAAFSAQTGRPLIYERVDVAPGELALAVREFRACGGVGMNVTVPLKAEACALAARREPRAAAAGAANTLWFDASGQIVADNTDGQGLVRDLEFNHAVPLRGQRVLLLGAGGAASGVLPALLGARPAQVLVSNRTAARAAELVARFADSGPVAALDWGTAPLAPVDVLVNATSASLSRELPRVADAALHPGTLCYDMMYGSEPTAFCAWARARGQQRVLDGLGMLVEQAAAAFAIWHGVAPDTGPVIAALRADLGKG